MGKRGHFGNDFCGFCRGCVGKAGSGLARVSTRSQPRARSQVLTPEEEIRVITRNIPRHGKGGEAELRKTPGAQSHEH